jgi:hypothetical protein
MSGSFDRLIGEVHRLWWGSTSSQRLTPSPAYISTSLLNGRGIFRTSVSDLKVRVTRKLRSVLPRPIEQLRLPVGVPTVYFVRSYVRTSLTIPFRVGPPTV